MACYQVEERIGSWQQSIFPGAGEQPAYIGGLYGEEAYIRDVVFNAGNKAPARPRAIRTRKRSTHGARKNNNNGEEGVSKFKADSIKSLYLHQLI